MGDYTKVIVNCSIKKIEDEKEIESFKDEFFGMVSSNSSSAYQCGGDIFHFCNEWHHRSSITFITQMKYGRGLEEFIEWLRPKVIQGSGDSDVFAMSFSEYQTEPTLHKMCKLKEIR